MTDQNLESRIEELESRLAFQDKAISELNDSVIAHQRRADRFQIVCDWLVERMKATGLDASGTADAADASADYEKPPHY